MKEKENEDDEEERTKERRRKNPVLRTILMDLGACVVAWAREAGGVMRM